MSRERIPDTDLEVDVDIEPGTGDTVITDPFGARWRRNRVEYPDGSGDTFNPDHPEAPLLVKLADAKERARGR